MDISEKTDESKPNTVLKDRWRQLVMFILGVTVVVLYFAGFLRLPDPLEGKPAKAFKLPSLEGEEVNLAQHLGKDVVLLDFWAVWCPPCRMSLPAVSAVWKEFGPSGLVVYAVNQQDTPGAVRNFLQNGNIEVPVLLDTDRLAGNAYKVTSIPKMVLVDRSGNVVFVHKGFGPGSEWTLRKAVAKALK